MGNTLVGQLWLIIYLWACNGKVSISLFCGLLCLWTAKAGNNAGMNRQLEKNYRLIFGE